MPQTGVGGFPGPGRTGEKPRLATVQDRGGVQRIQMVFLRKKQKTKTQRVENLFDMILFESIRSAVSDGKSAVLLNGHLVDAPVFPEQKAIYGTGITDLQFIGTDQDRSVFFASRHTDAQINLLIGMIDRITREFFKIAMV